MKRAFQKCSQKINLKHNELFLLLQFQQVHISCINLGDRIISLLKTLNMCSAYMRKKSLCVVEGCAHCVLQYNKCFFQKESAAVVTLILLHCCALKCVYCMLFGQLQQLKVKKTPKPY